MKSLLPVFILLFILSGCQSNSNTKKQDDGAKAYREYVSTLASDQFRGRKPFTKGETLTVNYLKDQFKKIGAQPGNGNSYFQEVPMVDIKSSFKDNKVVFKGKKGTLSLQPLDEIVGNTRRAVKTQEINSAPLIFMGFGIDAPEYNWNDYADVDVKGKILVVMVNDPGFYNPKLFRGRNMTYYGRWTYKYEEAARKGAAGVLIIHATKPASYGWGVVRSGWGVASSLYLQAANHHANRCALEGWVTREAAQKLFHFAGIKDVQKLLDSAKKPGFKPVPLHISLTTTLQNEIKKNTSKNVIAILPGTDLKNQYVIYTAHWDHLGVGEPVNGDSIYNGAADNASGTAGLLWLARKFKAAPQTRRTLVFLAVTGEEQGLLGSEYYTKHPIFPLKNTVVDINMDVLQPFGKMKDIYLIGKGQSSVDQYLIKEAKKQGRVVRQEEDRSAGVYFRSDHFNFAKVGIPTLYTEGGVESVEHGKAWGKKQAHEYNKNKYHRPQDEYSPSWDISGSLQDLNLLYQTGKDLADTTDFPTWNDGVLFKKIRQKERGTASTDNK